MKAAVIYAQGEMPQYVDIPEPVVQPGEALVTVKAVALKHFDRSREKGTHYSSVGHGASAARVIGGDGVCVMPDGSRVYAIGASGMMAEKATVETDRIVPVPDGLDEVIAAALPNAVIGSAMALRFRAGIEPGDTVLINGATGFTGRVAVQVARHNGAGKIVVTGRNPASLERLRELGADEVLALWGDGGGSGPDDEPKHGGGGLTSGDGGFAHGGAGLTSGDEAFVERLRLIHGATPINVIVDYLWGHSAELILAALQGKGGFSPRTRFVSVGAVTGDEIRLSAALLRSVDLQLSGSGLGSWTKKQVGLLFTEILPQFFRLAAEGKLVVDTVPVNLCDIGGIWAMEVLDGKRLVVRL